MTTHILRFSIIKPLQVQLPLRAVSITQICHFSHAPRNPTHSSRVSPQSLSGCQTSLLQSAWAPNLHTARHKSDAPTAAPPVNNVTPPADVAYIPDPPSVDVAQTVSEQLNALGEPTLSSLGLCSNYPSGWVQWLMEHMHVTADLPWWATIALFGAGLRVIMIPLQIYTLKTSIPQHNILPKYMELHGRLKEAERSNDIMAAQRCSMKVQEFQTKNDVRPLKTMTGMLYQTPIFLSVFSGLRGMANLPVESMANGGWAWFPDLTIADPFVILPILTGTALLINIELGADGMRANTLDTTQRWMLRGFMIVGIPLFMSFQPAALSVYWLSANLTGILTMRLIQSTAFKKYVDIPERIKLHTDFTKKPPKVGFFQSFVTFFQELRIKNATADQDARNESAFRNAGMAKKVKTFKYDPTKLHRT